MAVVAYLRVSTEKQFLENQREEIIRFAEKNGLSIGLVGPDETGRLLDYNGDFTA